MNRSLRALILAAGLSSIAGLSMAAAPADVAPKGGATADAPVSAPAKKHVKKHSVRKTSHKRAKTAHAAPKP